MRRTDGKPNGLGSAMRVLLTGLLGIAVLAACSGGKGLLGSGKPAQPLIPPVKISITPGSGATGAKTTGGITVSTVDGKIRSVVVRTAGDPVTGSLNAAATQWHSRWTLNTDTHYTVTVTAVDVSGKTVSATSSFRTINPAQSLQTQIFEGYQQAYGVGMPILLNFSQPVTNKAAVERALDIKTSVPVVGAWYWDNDTTLAFRPKSYWPAHTKIQFVGHLDGVEAAPGVYGTSDLTQSFQIGDSLISYVSTANHHMQLYKNGVKIATWPISAGQPGDDTPNGSFLTIDRGNPVRMRPADIKPGQPGYYDVKVFWSVRFTWSGDYIHAAPWSVGSQGSANVSHGCVNLAPDHAQIYYQMGHAGDPVVVSGSPVHGKWDDGWTEWFLTWSQLVQGSALHGAVQAGPSGSVPVDPVTLRPIGAPTPAHTHAATGSPAPTSSPTR